jgi:hypothetical protein
MSGDKIRAVRNRNPLNIERRDPWQGLMPEADMTPEQKAETRFCVFQSPKWGFRAAAHILIKYQDRDKIDTIAGIVAKWAPSTENDVVAYVRHVCELSEIAANAPVNMHSYADVAPIVKAMATHEAGGWYFSDEDLKAGLTLAGLPPPAEALAKSRTVKTATAAIGSTAIITSVAESAQQLAPAVNLVKQIHDFAPTVAIVILAGAVIIMFYFRVDDWRRAAR